MIRATFNYDNKTLGGILLASYTRKTDVCVENKSTKKQEIDTVNQKFYLVFIPFKDRLKQIAEIKQEDMILTTLNLEPEWIRTDKFTSKFDESDDYVPEKEIEITDYYGYPFIVNNNSFLINQKYQNSEYTTDVLYKAMPELVSEN